MAKKIIKKKKTQEPSFNLTEMQNTQLEFARIKAQKKQLEEREKELKTRLDEFMSRTFEPDSKGHYLFTTINEKGEKIHLQKQSRRKITLDNEKAIPYLKKKGFEHLIIPKIVIAEEVTQDQLIEVLIANGSHLLEEIQEVDEGELERAVMNEEIPFKEFESLCTIEQNYAMAFIKDDKLEINE